MLPNFDIVTARTGSLFREARLAMLTHRMIFHMDMTEAAADKVEAALAELLDATAAERH
jgi:hypothetical protein